MSGMFNPIIFYSIAASMIFCAILTINLKNIFHSLLSAICVFFLAGLLFYILGSEYNAIIQIAIYGVAIPIILGIAVMFTDFKNPTKNLSEQTNLKYLILLISGIFILAFSYLILTSNALNPMDINLNINIKNTSIQVINTFSKKIFIDYVWAFELVSIILTIVVAGLTLFNRVEEEK
ncbi:NADH-quinone oxidoreductase subunit J [bacterium]|nr:NADH-quinone oxidoreductase subunit J [bacterium]